jgi:hypothetical protein
MGFFVAALLASQTFAAPPSDWAEQCAQIEASWKLAPMQEPESTPKQNIEPWALQKHLWANRNWYGVYAHAVLLDDEKFTKCKDFNPLIYLINRYDDVISGKTSIGEFWDEWRKQKFDSTFFWVLAHLDETVLRDQKFRDEFAAKYSVPALSPIKLRYYDSPYDRFLYTLDGQTTPDNSKAVNLWINLCLNSDGSAGEGLWYEMAALFAEKPEVVIKQIEEFRKEKDWFQSAFCEGLNDHRITKIQDIFKSLPESPERNEVLSWVDCGAYLEQQRAKKSEN